MNQMEHLEIVNVNSSAIKTIIWDLQARQMMVKFKDSPLYVYPTVTRDEFEAFVKSESKGQHFRELQKRHPDFIRLDN